MATTRDPNNLYGLTEWTDKVERIPNQYGYIKSRNFFNVRPTGDKAIVFDKSSSTTTLLPSAQRGQRAPTVGKDRDVETFAIQLGFFKHEEYITPEDIQSQRMIGTPDGAETLANVRAEKFEDGRRAVDQTHEFMMIEAVKGVSVTPDGVVLADMFSLFGISQEVFDFDLGTATTEVYNKVSEVKRFVQSELKSGGVIQGIQVMCSTSFFDKLIVHPSVKEAYLNWQSNNRYREEFSQYFSWGISDMFEYNGVMFFTYPATMIKPDGTTYEPVATNEAHVIPVTRDLFRGYYGPNDKLTGANQRGREIFAFEYRDPRDEFHEIMFETAPLFFSTNPKVLAKITTST